jgi:hypothetical protein
VICGGMTLLSCPGARLSRGFGLASTGGGLHWHGVLDILVWLARGHLNRLFCFPHGSLLFR